MTFKHKKYSNRNAFVMAVHDGHVLYRANEITPQGQKVLGIFLLSHDKFVDRYTGV